MKKIVPVAMAASLVMCTMMFLGAASAGTAGEDVIRVILADAQMTFAETRDDLVQNGGVHFVLGDGNGGKQTSGEGLVLIAAENENPMYNLDQRLDDTGETIDRNQAFHIKFKPSAKDFGLMMGADNNAGIAIGENGEPLMFVSGGAYMETMSGGLQIEPGQWYHALLAMQSGGVMQVALWKDGEESKIAGGYVNIGSAYGDDVYQNKSWEMSLGFRGAATVTVDSYEYYTFSGFVMDFKSVEGGPVQGGDDYGPLWAINIAGNFDIMSDMVWQSVAPQEVQAGGDMSFTGYNLADLMNFSGNGSDRARIVFGQEGTEAAYVEPTYDAYIVYLRDGEFLGGPYLLSINGLSEYPVIEVHPE